jgi:transglutaminase-like putative cysteine protease
MYYSIRHLTSFRYSSTISQSVMEVRMQPLSEGFQRCLAFEVLTSPAAKVLHYSDHLGNTVHHFDIPAQHGHLEIVGESIVYVGTPELTADVGGPGTDAAPAIPANPCWSDVDDLGASGLYWDMLNPSKFARPSSLLTELAAEIGANRESDPRTVLRKITQGIHEGFTYCPQSTTVDSHIDEALESRRGVCQDFSHVMITLVRSLGIPCRYVSGYLFHRSEDQDRSAADATHAWVEALLPGAGWIGYDPTNNLMAGGRHIRVAVGRDYSDVPPTRGVFQGDASSELTVSVEVSPCEAPVLEDLSAYLSDAHQVDQQQQQ